MEYRIRAMKKEEYVLLQDFLYQAIFVPEGMEPPPKSIIHLPELQEYVAGFGGREHDRAFVAEVKGKVVGAVWSRIMEDYGHIDGGAPSLAIALYKEYRGRGIGTALLKEFLASLKAEGYTKVSLSVQKENAAVKLYEKTGFSIYRENTDDYIMRVFLTEREGSEISEEKQEKRE